MKKTLVALAALAAAGAFAQTADIRSLPAGSVQIFGVADVTVNRLASDGSGSVTRMAGDGRNESTRLGFRGYEDMGGGMAASFWLEAAYNQDDGTGSNTTVNNTAAGDKIAFGASSATNNNIVTVPANQSLTARQGLTFNRAANVSIISKDFGEIRVGRDYSPSFWNFTQFDPFGTVGVGSAMNIQGSALAPFGIQTAPPGAAYPMVRTSNSIGWLSQSMSGFSAQIQYALSEQPTPCVTPSTTINGNYCFAGAGDGKSIGIRLQYKSGPIHAAFAQQNTNYGDVAAARGFFIGPTAPAVSVAGTTDAALANQAASRGSLTIQNMALAYTVGNTKLATTIGSQVADQAQTTGKRTYNHWNVGVTHTMGALALKASYGYGKRTDGALNSLGTAYSGQDGSDIAQTAVGFVYDLSRRSAVYGTYSTITQKAGTNAAATGVGSIGLNSSAIPAGGSVNLSGIDLGIRHRF